MWCMLRMRTYALWRVLLTSTRMRSEGWSVCLVRLSMLILALQATGRPISDIYQRLQNYASLKFKRAIFLKRQTGTVTDRVAWPNVRTYLSISGAHAYIRHRS